MKRTVICAAALLLVVLLVSGGTQAVAGHNDPPPPASFLPDDDGAPTASLIVSDRNDGVDERAHLTALATQATDQVEWRVCPSTVTGTDGISATELSQCSLILATDTSGVPSALGNEAYEAYVDIPSTIDDTTSRHLLLLACVGSARVTSGTSPNCSTSLQEDIRFDDASNSAPGSSAGHIFRVCFADSNPDPASTSDLDGPESAINSMTAAESHAEDPCELRPADEDLSTNPTLAAEVDAQYRSFFHGMSVPNDGFVLRVRTSLDIDTPGELLAVRDLSGVGTAPSSQQDPDDADDLSDNEVGTGTVTTANTGTCEPVTTTSTFVRWECAFADAGPADDNVLQAIVVSEAVTPGSGSGLCDSGGGVQCRLDAGFVFSVPRSQLPSPGSTPSPPGSSTPTPSATATPTPSPSATTASPRPTVTVTVTQPPQSPAPTVTVMPQGTGTVRLESSNPSKNFGRPFTFTGGISSNVTACVVGRTVAIMRTVSGTNSQVQFDTLVTNSEGTFSKTYDADASAVYVASIQESPECAGDTSDGVPVEVRANVKLKLNKIRIPEGGTVTIKAIVAPCPELANTTIELHKGEPRGQVGRLASKRLSSDCRAVFRQKIARDSVFQLQWPKQDEDHEAGKSRKKAVIATRARRR